MTFSYASTLRRVLSSQSLRAGVHHSTAIATYLGNPQKRFRIIHVAGTNGKGTVCVKLAAGLRGYGYTVGLYTSPHLATVRERIKIDGELISETDFVKYAEMVTSSCEKANVPLSFFEILTQMAFSWFADNAVDWAVIETGLGGELDATNIVQPQLAIITCVAYDHMKQLGNSLSDIARAKAGIIKNDASLLLSQQAASHEEILRCAATKRVKPFILDSVDFYESADEESSRLVCKALEILMKSSPTTEQIDIIRHSKPPCRQQALDKKDLKKALKVANNILGTSVFTDNVPLGILFDVSHNQCAMDRLCVDISRKFPNTCVRFCIALSSERKVDIYLPIVTHFRNKKQNLLAGIHAIAPDAARLATHSQILDKAAAFGGTLAEEILKFYGAPPCSGKFELDVAQAVILSAQNTELLVFAGSFYSLQHVAITLNSPFLHSDPILAAEIALPDMNNYP